MKREEVSKMSDVEVAASAIRLTKRRVRGKRTMPEAYVTVAPLPVMLGESVQSFLSINYRPTDGSDFFQALYHEHGIGVLKCRIVDRNKMRTTGTSIFLTDTQGLL